MRYSDYDESSVRIRPNKKGSRPRTKDRPAYEQAVIGRIITVDRGRYTAILDEDTANERIVHLHHNVPGVMARLNSLLAKYDMNIGSQTLSTKGQFGYAVTDVQGERYDGLLADLQELDETLKVRVL